MAVDVLVYVASTLVTNRSITIISCYPYDHGVVIALAIVFVPICVVSYLGDNYADLLQIISFGGSSVSTILYVARIAIVHPWDDVSSARILDSAVFDGRKIYSCIDSYILVLSGYICYGHPSVESFRSAILSTTDYGSYFVITNLKLCNFLSISGGISYKTVSRWLYREIIYFLLMHMAITGCFFSPGMLGENKLTCLYNIMDIELRILC